MRTKALASRRRASVGRLAKNSPNASKCPPPWITAIAFAVILDMGPDVSGDMSQNAPLSVPY
jgi:hypothetical protein